MGHRANFVLIREGGARAFHDQWAALGSTWAFAGGPATAVSAAEQSHRRPGRVVPGMIPAACM